MPKRTKRSCEADVKAWVRKTLESWPPTHIGRDRGMWEDITNAALSAFDLGMSYQKELQDRKKESPNV